MDIRIRAAAASDVGRVRRKNEDAFIFQASQHEPIYDGMCTTVVAAHFDGSRMWIGHVGDSRAYLLRRQSLHRLTDDHSQLAQRLRDGQSRFRPASGQNWIACLPRPSVPRTSSSRPSRWFRFNSGTVFC